MKPVEFLPSAREDIRREKAYYRAINPDLARRFQVAVEAASNAVSRQPQAMAALEYDIRRWPLETFPHGLLYRDLASTVLIIAVFHPSQAPEKWHSRAPIQRSG